MVELTQKEGFARNANLEVLLGEINGLLQGPEQVAIADYDHPRLPMVMVVGAPRSGTTLMMQWLANSGAFAYPSNLLSRFYQAPYIGVRIQQMLCDPQFAFRDELAGWQEQAQAFRNNLGKTSGTLSPNEFWYFWRRFFQYGEIQQLSAAALETVDMKTLKAELGALTSAFGKPFACKGLMFNWNLPFLAEQFPNLLFIYTRRDPFANAQSLLRARKQYFGTIERWYSFKPPSYTAVAGCDPYHQVAVQVMETNRDVQVGLDQIDPARWIEIDYEDFCGNPEALWATLRQRLAGFDWELTAEYQGPCSFQKSSGNYVSDEELPQLEKAFWNRYHLRPDASMMKMEF